VDATEPTPARAFQPGDLVGELFADRYRVQRLVSSGANTAIFDASDEQNGRTVTLKLIRPKLAASPSFRNRFDETMRAVASLSHPNVAAMYDWGIARVADTSSAYVVNEYLAGGSLRDLFDRGRRLSPSQALSLGLDVCRALDYAHRRRFVHGELNPSKIVFGDDRRVRIIDFGLARLLSSGAWQAPDRVPTNVAWYASPEQGLGEPIDGRADVYALALMLHEAVTGTLPFKSDSTVATLGARVGKLMPVSADLGALASVLERAGRPEADERATAAEFGKGLLQAASKLPRPEPLPLLSTGLFETPAEQMRTPDDPTGGVFRPAAPAPVVVVPLDEPDPGSDAPDTPGAVPTDPDTNATDVAQSDADTVDAAPVPAAETPSESTVDEIVIAPLDASGFGESPAPAVGVEDTADLPIADGSGELVIAAHEATSVMPATVEEMPRRRRGFPWKILLALIVVGALVALGVLATQLFQRPTYPVPDVVGMPVDEARNLVSANDWVIDVQRERSDEVPEVGAVVRTAPGAGVELAENEPFLIVVSDGPLLRELPESMGKPASEATSDLLGRQLQVETVEQFDEVVAPGVVISWSVPGDATLAAGAMVEPETPVQLVVSTGPAPRVVPNLFGLSLPDAQSLLAQQQLTVAEAEQVFSDDVPLGLIVVQNIAEGSEVPRDTQIMVAISRGPDLVAFPDLTGLATFDQVAGALTAAGFQPVLVFGDALGVIQSITINGEPATTGVQYRRGALVEITAL
jgi:eukaryotic-like serine/threonine-protein kinase